MVAIQTQGRDSTDAWVTSFRLQYSPDCATFNDLLGVNGNNQVRNFYLLICYAVKHIIITDHDFTLFEVKGGSTFVVFALYLIEKYTS